MPGHRDIGGGPPDGWAPGSERPFRRRPGELSSLVLEVLRQEGGPLTPIEVRQRLTGAGVAPLAYTTVLTILSRLLGQDLVERFRTGRSYSYRALVDTTLAARRMRRVLDDQDDPEGREAVLASFVHALSAEDERRLRELLGDFDTTSGTDPGTRFRDRGR